MTDVGHEVVDGAANKDDPLLEQAGVYVVRTLATCRLLHDNRHEIQGTHRLRCRSR